MTNLKTSQELQSKVIDFLRFPLIIGVLFIHNSASTIQIDGGVVFGSGENMPLMYYCSNLFSKVIAAIAVPLFFFMSGFLFFLNVNKFSGWSYKNKLADSYVGDCETECTGHLIIGYTASGVKLARHVFRL